MIGRGVPTGYDSRMRPPGVQQRIRKLLDDEWEHVHSQPDLAFRVNLTDFIGLAARLWYHDHPIATVLNRYRTTRALMDDPLQRRTGTDFERAGIDCIRQLEPELGRFVHEPAELAPFEEQDSTERPLLQIPPRVLLGEVGPDSYYHLACWNEANSLVEGVQTPYRAAQRTVNMRIHEPPDAYGLLPELTGLVIRYEDVPDLRRETGELITAVFVRYIERVPWGRTGTA
jgi:hypothetical protein